MALLILFTFSQVQADDNKATPKDVYDIVLKAYEVVKALGDEALPAFNDPKGEFLYKDTYVNRVQFRGDHRQDQYQGP
jgi:cytochrome c